MALAVYVPFPEDDSNSTNHDLVSSLYQLYCSNAVTCIGAQKKGLWML